MKKKHIAIFVLEIISNIEKCKNIKIFEKKEEQKC
jgi:hypothetical protein